MSRPSGPRLWTVGHGAHRAAHLIALLEGQGIRCLVDVRSVPFSRRHPQHSRPRMGASLAERGIEYRWEGEALGGRPDPARHPGFFSEAGRPVWERLRNRGAFRAGLERLAEWAAAKPTAVLCAEEDPRRCHRLHLICPAWAARLGADIRHIRGDGRIETHLQVIRQRPLFA